ncbi:hypothetical protein ACLB2K_000889 [Fragaria x ananassa]
MNEGFMQCSANYRPLSPISFLERAAVVTGDKPSVVYGGVRYSWKETLQRCLNFASALVRLGVSRHDVVSSFCTHHSTISMLQQCSYLARYHSFIYISMRYDRT